MRNYPRGFERDRQILHAAADFFHVNRRKSQLQSC
jgi:hypothetical protein